MPAALVVVGGLYRAQRPTGDRRLGWQPHLLAVVTRSAVPFSAYNIFFLEIRYVFVFVLLCVARIVFCVDSP